MCFFSLALNVSASLYIGCNLCMYNILYIIVPNERLTVSIVQEHFLSFSLVRSLRLSTLCLTKREILALEVDAIKNIHRVHRHRNCYRCCKINIYECLLHCFTSKLQNRRSTNTILFYFFFF